MKTRIVRILVSLLLFAPIALAQSRQGQNCPITAPRAVVDISASGDNAVIAADPNKRIFVWQWFFVNSHATQDESITIKEGSTAISGAYLIKAGGGSHTAICTGTPWAIVPKGSAFNINLSATGTVRGTVYYTLED